MQIEGRSWLVSGGASGLGRAVAARIVDNGGFAVIIDVNGQLARQTAEQLGERVVAAVGDITDEQAVQEALDAAVALAPLAGAVNCAGVGSAMKTVSKGQPHDLAIFRRVVEINLIGTFNVLRLTAARLVGSEAGENGERGVIVNTASIAAFDGQRGQIAYSASKGGVVGLTLPAARDLARDGVRVVTIAPGLFDTPLLAGLPEPARAALAEMIPFPKRLGKPEEYAMLVEQCIRNTMLNGEVIRLDGALRMQP